MSRRHQATQVPFHLAVGFVVVVEIAVDVARIEGGSVRDGLARRGDQFVGCCRHVKPSGLGLRWNGLVDTTARVFGRSGAEWSNRGWKVAFV
jgi:hypothetical protein